MIIELTQNEKIRCYKCNLLLENGDIAFFVEIEGKLKISCMWCHEGYREEIKTWESPQASASTSTKPREMAEISTS